MFVYIYIYIHGQPPHWIYLSVVAVLDLSLSFGLWLSEEGKEMHGREKGEGFER
jgi:hypothetical protein